MESTHFFNINTGSNEPIYRQLIAQVRRRIASGQLSAGQAMPSVRESAKALAIHPMTISKAYSLMVEEGLLEHRRGRSMIVAAQHQTPLSDSDRIVLVTPILKKAAAEVHQLGLPLSQAVQLFEQILKKEDSP